MLSGFFPSRVGDMPAKPTPIDDYLAALNGDQRAALQKLRQTIRAAAPGAEECISYGLPAFRLNGKFFVAIGASKNHCAFYPGAVIANLGVDLKAYDLSKGTIRFPADQPLPAALVKKIVKARIAQNAAKKKTAKK